MKIANGKPGTKVRFKMRLRSSFATLAIEYLIEKDENIIELAAREEMEWLK